jgi:hypothetical protein
MLLTHPEPLGRVPLSGTLFEAASEDRDGAAGRKVLSDFYEHLMYDRCQRETEGARAVTEVAGRTRDDSRRCRESDIV